MSTFKQNKLAFLKLLFCTFSLNLAAAKQTFADEVEKTPLNKLIGTEELTFSGFVDTAFSYDFNKFDPRNRSYLTQPTRDREMQLTSQSDEVVLLETSRLVPLVQLLCH